LVALRFIWQRLLFALLKGHPVNVIQDDEDGNGENYWHDLPSSYMPEPFLLPSLTIKGMSEAMSAQGRPPSMSTVTIDVLSPQTPIMTTTATTICKSSSFPQLRPINIIQHDNSGSREDLSGQGEPETVELHLHTRISAEFNAFPWFLPLQLPLRAKGDS